MQLAVPAILPKSFEELSEKVSLIRKHTRAVQLDVCDGNFVDAMTWPYRGERPTLEELIGRGEVLPSGDTVHYEVDLMVARPERVVGQWIALGATRLVIHAGSTPDFPGLIRFLEETHGYIRGFAGELLSVGIAVPVGLPLRDFAHHLSLVDFVQCMGIVNIGRQGQEFDPRVVAKVREIRKRYPEMPVQVDGGVSLANAPALLDAGASRLAVGSALFSSESIAETLHAFEKLSERYGVYE